MAAEVRLKDDASPPMNQQDIIGDVDTSISLSQKQSIYHSLSTYPFNADPEYQAGLATILGHPETPITDAELSDKADLVLQTQCFYFARKHNLQPIDANDYASWLHSSHLNVPQPPATQASDTQHQQPSSSTNTNGQIPLNSSDPIQARPTSNSQTQNQQEEIIPPYPTSFAAIVDLITRNQPIPGIEEIPPTVLEPGSSKIDKTPRRKKPWEENEEQQTTSPEADISSSVNMDDRSNNKNEESERSVLSMQDRNGDIEPETNTGQRRNREGVVDILLPSAIPESGLLARE